MKKFFFPILASAWLLGHAQTGQSTGMRQVAIPHGIKLIKYDIDSSLGGAQEGDGITALSNLMTQGQPVFQANMCYSSKDTTAVVAVPDGNGGAGLRVVIIGDSCGIFHRTADETFILPKTCSLLLSRKPPFSGKETVWGKIGFEGEAGSGNQFVIYGRFRVTGEK